MRGALARRLALLCGLSVMGAAFAQVPADPSNYSRTTGYAYNADGTLDHTTVEPSSAQSCHSTYVTYDTHGNVATSKLQNCSGATGTQLFAARAASAAFNSEPTQGITTAGSLTPNVTVAVPAGIGQTTSTNALLQQTLTEFDPRFGAVTRKTDADQRVTQAVVDDFGRPIKQTAPDGTSVRTFYCFLAGSVPDATSNTAGCPTPPAGEAPPYAVRFVHTEPRDVNDTKMGAFARVYYDKLDRAIRSVTESFDGSSQPAARRGVTVAGDTVYDANGAKSMETRPYFLATGSTTIAGSKDVGVTRFDYDAMGRTTATYVSDPDATTGNQQDFGSGTFGYANYGTRTVSTTRAAFAGMKTTTTNDLGQAHIEEHNAIGQVTRATDANAAQVAYLYDAFGNTVKVVDALKNTITTAFDIQGAKTQLNDPDHGVLVYCYDAIGQLKAQQSSAMRGNDTPAACPTDIASGTTATVKAGWATVAYDKLGRTTQHAEPESVATWTYDSCASGVGELCKATTSLGETKTYGYDGVGRLLDTRVDIASGPSFASAVSFDATTGRLASKTYPSGLQVGYGYTGRGFVQKLLLNTAVAISPLPDAQGHVAASRSLAAGSSLWTATSVDAASAWEGQAVGNGVSEAVTQNPSNGRAWTIKASIGGTASILDQAYSWDGVSNVRSRTDNIGSGSGAVTETFHYDTLNRLDGYSVASPGIPGLDRDVSLQYNALGMLLYKSDVGNYVYPNATSRHAHALASNDGNGASYGVDLNGNVRTASAGKYARMTYTSFDNVLAARGGATNYSWLYDESHARLKETRTVGGNTRVVWYLHPDNAGGLAFEVETDTSPSAVQDNRHFLSVNGQVIGMFVSSGSLPVLAAGQMEPPAPTGSMALVKVEYWHKDHLGSLAATTDHWGVVTDRYSYDPFGKRRYTDGRYDAMGTVTADWSPSANYGTARGFTGHEQLDDIGIVNMNGRLYDATLGMFVQADPHVSNPDNLQNYNRYAYLLNNPLNGTDPTGFDGPTQNLNVNTGIENLGSGGWSFSFGQLWNDLANLFSGGGAGGTGGSGSDPSDGTPTNTPSDFPRTCGGMGCPHRPPSSHEIRQAQRLQKFIRENWNPNMADMGTGGRTTLMNQFYLSEVLSGHISQGEYNDYLKGQAEVAGTIVTTLVPLGAVAEAVIAGRAAAVAKNAVEAAEAVKAAKKAESVAEAAKDIESAANTATKAGTTGQKAEELEKYEGLTHRAGSKMKDNLTPRRSDTEGLSTFKNPVAGQKNQVIDTTKLRNLSAHLDNNPPGHVSIRPIDASQMEGWMASKGTDTVHPFTQELLDAIIETVKGPK